MDILLSVGTNVHRDKWDRDMWGRDIWGRDMWDRDLCPRTMLMTMTYIMTMFTIIDDQDDDMYI